MRISGEKAIKRVASNKETSILCVAILCNPSSLPYLSGARHRSDLKGGDAEGHKFQSEATSRPSRGHLLPSQSTSF